VAAFAARENQRQLRRLWLSRYACQEFLMYAAFY
jgi:hypothetical protein